MGLKCWYDIWVINECFFTNKVNVFIITLILVYNDAEVNVKRLAMLRIDY